MRRWNAHQIAHAAGAQLLSADSREVGGPDRVTIDSRDATRGALFVGLPGEHVDGGSFASAALDAGGWGVLVAPEHAQALRVTGGSDPAPAPAAGAAPGAGAADPDPPPPAGAVLVAADPLAALQRLATAWRRELGAQVIGVTGSTGKTSTKELLLAVLSPYRLTVASQANFNTEIGLPLQILGAPAGTEVLVLEMGMRGAGQIAELARIAEPDVGVIVSIGPVHLEQLGSIEAVAAAKAELIAALAPGDTAVVPAGERLLDPHLRSDLRTVTFGPGGDVRLGAQTAGQVEIDADGLTVSFQVDFTEAHLRHDLLAAVAACLAVGVQPGGRLELTLSPGRGRRSRLPGDITLIDDAYNANPVSMRAALDALSVAAQRPQATAPLVAERPSAPLGAEERPSAPLGAEERPSAPLGAERPSARKVAVLGDMLELGPDAERYHREIGEHANEVADVLVTVGPLAASMAGVFDGEHHHAPDASAAAALVPTLLTAGDVVLVKGSNGVGLKLVCETLAAATPA